MVEKKRLCVVGAGAAGLCALKYSLQHNFDAVAYEQCEEIGGVWVYSDSPVSADMEDEVHNSMYAGLRTNLPKEIMDYSDFEYKPCEASYVTQSQVLEYLQEYASHFKLRDHIQLQHEVIRVCLKDEVWQVIVRNKITNTYHTELYDFVFICNGHYSKPHYPNIPGMKSTYRGKQLHSHYYRKAEHFKDSHVLIIGFGPSGSDICQQVQAKATRVLLSHHVDTDLGVSGLSNVVAKRDVLRLTETGAIFADGSEEHFDTIIYCTGYDHHYPFISVECGIFVKQNYVQPLYKHCISINHPSMAFIGLPFKCLVNPMFDLQVRFALQFFCKLKELPSHADMLADMKKEEQIRKDLGWGPCAAHQMKQLQFAYFNDLAEIAELENITAVKKKILSAAVDRLTTQVQTFRNWQYKIIDDSTFEEKYVRPEHI